QTLGRPRQPSRRFGNVRTTFVNCPGGTLGKCGRTLVVVGGWSLALGSALPSLRGCVRHRTNCQRPTANNQPPSPELPRRYTDRNPPLLQSRRIRWVAPAARHPHVREEELEMALASRKSGWAIALALAAAVVAP